MILPPDDSVARPLAGRSHACAAAPDAPRSADAQNNAVTRGASSTACRRRHPPSLRADRKPSDAPHNMPHPRLPRHPAARGIPPPHFSRQPRFRRLRAALPLSCFCSPRGFRLLPPRSIPRAFSCAFPALLPDSIPPFCASFVKSRHKLHAVAQNLCNAAHLRALRPDRRRNFPATPSAGHGLPT